MQKIKLTQGKYALVDDEDFEYLNQWKWHYDCGYAKRTKFIGTFNGKEKSKKIYMHRELIKTEFGVEVDHINGDKNDNRRTNLRAASKGQNGMNKTKMSGLSSQYKGVSWYKRLKKWQVKLALNGKTIHLGLFHSETDAALTYNQAALKYFGEFARLNEVPT